MANTWSASAQVVTYASGKSMISLFNGAAATRVLRVYRMYHFNSNTSSVSGVLTEMRVNRISTSTGGTTITPVSFDTTNSALEGAVVAATGANNTVSALFRRYIYSNDEPTVGTGTIDEFELLIPFACVWQEGYGDSNMQALTARVDEGYEIKQQGTSAVSSADLEILFTDSAT